MDRTIILCTVIQVPGAVKYPTYSAVTNTDNTYLGTTTNGGIRAWRSMHVEYIDGALLAVTLRLRNTIRTLPNVPAGRSIALMSPGTSPSELQAGTEGADIAAAAPRHSRVICSRLEMPRNKFPGTLTVGILRPRYEYAKIRQLISWRLDHDTDHNKT